VFDFVALFKKIVCVLIRFSHAGEKVLRAFHILLIVGFDLSGVVLFIFLLILTSISFESMTFMFWDSLVVWPIIHTFKQQKICVTQIYSLHE